LLGFLTLLPELLVYGFVRLAFALVGLLSPTRASNLGGAFLRRVGPLLPAHRIAAENLRLAMPELDAPARRRVLQGAWDNLGRMACEYVHMADIGDFDPAGTRASRIELPDAVVQQFFAMRDDGKPALVFTAHLANWELPALLAKQHGMAAAALYRTPNNRFVARYILALRSGLMGRLISAGRTAPLALAGALDRGEHVGMLVDQRFGRGARLPFFGRPATTNPLLAKLARHYDCPVYGVRAIRLPGVRFRIDLVGPIALPRDAEGRIDELGAMACITAVVEGWVREYPDQWLWMHRRWRL
jgi:KDO2-lipid IV(A) lauroyltransferase